MTIIFILITYILFIAIFYRIFYHLNDCKNDDSGGLELGSLFWPISSLAIIGIIFYKKIAVPFVDNFISKYLK